MTVMTNGHRPSPAGHAAVPGDEVAQLLAEVERAQRLVAIQHDPALSLALTTDERAADRGVDATIREAQRAERQRAGLEQVRLSRRERGEQRWVARARAARQRLLNPDRRLASTYRRYVGLTCGTTGVIAAGIAWMANTVHDGLVGHDGSWLAYLVEPLASVLLVVSLVAQFTAVQNNRRNPEWFLWLDAGFVTASLLLNVIPWGLRYGWDAGQLIAHVLPPLLVAAAVAVQHMLNNLFQSIFENAHAALDEDVPERTGEEIADVVVLLERYRRAMSKGEVDPNYSVEQIARYFGCRKLRAQRTKDSLDLLARQGLLT
ncbi:MAG: hypothetical protein AB7I38_11750 [Dehalococcoidia bacterium]